MRVIRDAAALKVRPIEELLDMAYAFGRSRGVLEGIEKVGTALARVQDIALAPDEVARRCGAI